MINIDTQKKILVTGATGFLGGRLTERLTKELKVEDVIAVGRNEKMAPIISSWGAVFKKGDITDSEYTDTITERRDFVIHCAALSSPWGLYRDFYKANVTATRNIIDSCLKNAIKRLIYISTPSIYVNHKDRFDVKENDPLPAVLVNHYAKTKLEAERLVKEARLKGLEVIILRPRAIVGAGDTAIFPRLLRAHNEGKLRIIGDGKNLADLTSVSNIVDAILLSLKASDAALGKAYNITNGEQVYFWEFLDIIFSKLNITLNKQKVPFSVMYGLAATLETVAKIRPGNHEPTLTCYGVSALAKSMTLNIDLAREYLGYVPRQTNEEVIDEFVNWWKSVNKRTSKN